MSRAQNDKKNWDAFWARYNALYSISQMNDSFHPFLGAMTNGSKNVILRATHLVTQPNIRVYCSMAQPLRALIVDARGAHNEPH